MIMLLRRGDLYLENHILLLHLCRKNCHALQITTMKNVVSRTRNDRSRKTVFFSRGYTSAFWDWSGQIWCWQSEGDFINSNRTNEFYASLCAACREEYLLPLPMHDHRDRFSQPPLRFSDSHNLRTLES